MEAANKIRFKGGERYVLLQRITIQFWCVGKGSYCIVDVDRLGRMHVLVVFGICVHQTSLF